MKPKFGWKGKFYTVEEARELHSSVTHWLLDHDEEKRDERL